MRSRLKLVVLTQSASIYNGTNHLLLNRGTVLEVDVGTEGVVLVSVAADLLCLRITFYKYFGGSLLIQDVSLSVPQDLLSVVCRRSDMDEMG